MLSRQHVGDQLPTIHSKVGLIPQSGINERTLTRPEDCELAGLGVPEN